jgi:hypothetical protein
MRSQRLSHVRSMQRELFHIISIPKRSYTIVHRLVEILSTRPSLVSHIRRVEVEHYHPLNVLADFARPGPSEPSSQLACVQELRLSGVKGMSVGAMQSLSECFPCLCVPDTILRSLAALVDSIPSASLVCLTLVFEYPERAGLKDLD